MQVVDVHSPCNRRHRNSSSFDPPLDVQVSSERVLWLGDPKAVREG